MTSKIIKIDCLENAYLLTAYAAALEAELVKTISICSIKHLDVYQLSNWQPFLA